MITRGINEIKITTKYNKYIFTKEEYDILEYELTGRFLIVRRIKNGDLQEVYFLIEGLESYGIRGGSNNE